MGVHVVRPVLRVILDNEDGGFGPELRVADRFDDLPESQIVVRDVGRGCPGVTRGAVGMIVGQIGAGRSVDELLAEYPYLEREDILQALRYAAWRAEEREVVLADA